MAEEKTTTVADLLAKSDTGTLVRHRSGVWSYPGAPMDPSGTNLRIPVESVTDADIQAGLLDGSFVAAGMGPENRVTAIRAAPAEGEVRMGFVSSARAGSVEAATELPVGSRPTHDAGARRTSQLEVETIAGRASRGEPLRQEGDDFGNEARAPIDPGSGKAIPVELLAAQQAGGLEPGDPGPVTPGSASPARTAEGDETKRPGMAEEPASADARRAQRSAEARPAAPPATPAKPSQRR